MKKNRWFAALAAVALVFAGCQTDLDSHEHSFSKEWTSDTENHWHASTCGHKEEVSGKAAHTFGEWKITIEATEEAEGKKERTCTVCSYNEKKIISKISEGFVEVVGTTITGTETWTPSSDVFVSGRQITIPDLIVCDHEVTRGEFKEVMGTDPSYDGAYDKDGNKLSGDAVFNNPVNSVNRYDAIVYCNLRSIAEELTPAYKIGEETDPRNWSGIEGDAENGYLGPSNIDSTWNALTYDTEADGYRLPTEVEWEWLARGGENYTYAGSNIVDDVAWYITNDPGTREVKTKQANGYGLYDMSGNVWEWCYDYWYDYVENSTADTGDASGSGRVRRGGSWYDYDGCCQVSYRSSDFPFSRCSFCGFRVVRSAN